jgi:inner membrane protein involved in colicin E2 resistance
LRHSAAAGFRAALGVSALFIELATVMQVTRKVDWYARDAS